MMDTDKPFESPKILIARAKENIEDFRARERAFMDSRPYETVTELDEKTGYKTMKLRLTSPVPPLARAVFSDAMNNLRHALDQAVNDAAVCLRGGKRNCYFPFGKDAAAFAFIYDSKRYKTIPVDLRPHLNSLRPYFGGDDFLYALGRLSGPNKHQIVFRLGLHTQEVSFHAIEDSECEFITPPKWDTAKGELPVLRIPPGGKVNANIRFTSHISLNEAAISGLQTKEGFAYTFLGVTERVVEGIEAETNRLLGERDNGQDAAPAA